jgi:Tfp pilus assembly PilM family ATPase/Tfp pilus assembly protein PilN
MTRIVVEWTRSAIRLAVAVGREGRMVLREVRSRPLADTGPETEALKALLGALKTQSDEVVVAVSREQAMTRIMKFPSSDPRELAQMVELYAKAQLPYPREQAVVGYAPVSSEGGFSTVTIAACHREVIDRPLASMRELGLVPTVVTLGSWGALGWYRQLKRATKVEEPCLLINVDDTRADLVLVAGERLLLSRSLGEGIREWGPSGDGAERLALEVERSRATIRKELPGTDVRAVMLTGLGPLAQWKDQVAARLGVRVQVVEAATPLTPTTRMSAFEFSPVVAAGLAIAELRQVLDLSPPELRLHASHRRQVRNVAAVGGLLVGVAALGASLLAIQYSRQDRLAHGLSGVVKEIEPTAKRVQEQSRLVQVVRAITDRRRQLASLLTEVLSKTPSSVTLESVAFERSREELTLRGLAASTQTVLDYLQALKGLDGVREVSLRYSTQRVTSLGERTSFELLVLQGHG